MVGGVLVGRCRRKSERHRLIELSAFPGQPGAAFPSMESGVEPDQRSAAPSEKFRVKPGGSRQLSATPLRRRNRPGMFDMVAPPGLSNFCSALLQNCPAMARAVASRRDAEVQFWVFVVSMLSRWTQRRWVTGFSPGRGGPKTSARRLSVSGSWAPAAATRRMRCLTACGVTK